MSEMQERIAQALKDAGLREDYDIRMALATAAIKAMREPTSDMLKAGSMFVWFEGRTFEIEDTTMTYQAMIDAALPRS